MTYDPLGRYHWIANGGDVSWMQYDGADVIEEQMGNASVARRYVFGPGTDEPLVWYEGAGTTDRRYLHADERGSIVAVTNDSATVIGTATTNTGSRARVTWRVCGSSTPARNGYPSSAFTTTKHECTRPRSAVSSRPILLATATG
jgi:hypothetical protein